MFYACMLTFFSQLLYYKRLIPGKRDLEKCVLVLRSQTLIAFHGIVGKAKIKSIKLIEEDL